MFVGTFRRPILRHILINGHRAHMLIVLADFIDSKSHYRTAAAIDKPLMYLIEYYTKLTDYTLTFFCQFFL